MLNIAPNCQSLLKQKQEQMHVQIRRQEREDVFKQKRIIQNNVNIESQLYNPEQLDEYINSQMKKCVDIYNNNLPDKYSDLINGLNELKRIQLNDQAGQSFILGMFKNDFINFLLLFLDQQFDKKQELQLHASYILVNFFGQMDKSSKYYYNSYIPMLNVLKGIIIKGFGRQLFIKFNPLIEASIHALGNIFQDQQDLVQEFKIQFGFVSLLKLSVYVDLVLWVIDVLTEQRIDFTQQEVTMIVEIIDINLKNNQNLNHCIKALNNLSQYAQESLYQIIQLPSINVIFELASGNQQLSLEAFQIITSLIQTDNHELLEQFLNKYQVIDLLLQQLSSFRRERRIESLFAIQSLSKVNEKYAQEIVKQINVIEKLITLSISNDAKQIIPALSAISTILSYGNVEINSKFILNNIFPMLKHTTTYLNDQILLYSLNILSLLLGQIDFFDLSTDIPGNEIMRSKVYILQQINLNSITNQIAEVYTQVNNQEIQSQIDHCLEIIDENQKYIENFV